MFNEYYPSDTILIVYMFATSALDCMGQGPILHFITGGNFVPKPHPGHVVVVSRPKIR